MLHAVCKAAYAFHAMQLVPFLMQFTPMPISASNCFAAHAQILVLFALQTKRAVSHKVGMLQCYYLDDLDAGSYMHCTSAIVKSVPIYMYSYHRPQG